MTFFFGRKILMSETFQAYEMKKDSPYFLHKQPRQFKDIGEG